MRVRFAPSPTGALHIGGVRTALYNYLLAKKEKGTFILRIEDTDQTRYVPGAEQYIIEALEWLGLEFDESPAKGGPYGPYRQSERKATGVYEKYAAELVASGNAYYAYDTPEELQVARAAAEAEGGKFKYDASTRLQLKNSLSLSAEDCAALEAAGASKVVRVKIPETGTVAFDDMVRGVVQFNCDELDDKVMLKNDGMPTYHLANIVDDHQMKITHVIRGEEWLSSTPLHVLLYRFFGWKAPAFAHLPLILKPEPAAYVNKKTVEAFTERFTQDFLEKESEFAEKKAQVEKNIRPLLQDIKSIKDRLKINEKKDSKLQAAVKTFLRNTMNGKLSKRDGDRLGMPVFPLDWQGETEKDSFRGFREWGFLPDAVLNILALLGWNDGTDQEIYSKEALVQQFSMERVSPSGARFDFKKANWFNKQYLAAMQATDLAALVQEDVAKAGLTATQDQLVAVAELLKMRLNYVSDFVTQSQYFFEAPAPAAVVEREAKNFKKRVLNKWTPALVEQLNTLITALEGLSTFEEAVVAETVKGQLGEEENSLLPMFRLGLSGVMGGPDVYAIMAVLGAKETCQRLTAFVEYTNTVWEENPELS